MKPTTEEEKILKEGLEKASENQDNTGRISSLAFWHRISCPPWAGSKPADLVCFQRRIAFLYAQSEVQEFSPNSPSSLSVGTKSGKMRTLPPITIINTLPAREITDNNITSIAKIIP